MDSILELYTYFAKFPIRAAIEQQFENKGVDFNYTAWNTQLTTLEADIPTYNEQLIPDIENFFFGTTESDLKNANFRGFKNLALLVWWTEIGNQQNDFDYRNGIAKIHVAVVYQFAAKSVTPVEAVIIDNQCNNILQLIETQMNTDRDETCPRILQYMNYPVLKQPIKYHNYLGIVMHVEIGTERNIM